MLRMYGVIRIKKYLKTLELRHKRAGRLLLEVPRDTSTGWVYENLGWVSPQIRWKRQLPTLVYKSITGSAPSYLTSSLTEMFNLSNQIHLHNTRQASKGNIYIPTVKTEYGKRAFHYSGAVLWNNLPL